eukprot:scaffold6848_cov195-Skeletonema_marinoi.AAC.3
MKSFRGQKDKPYLFVSEQKRTDHTADVHPSLQNQCRLRYEMKKLGNKVIKFTLEDLPKFEEMTGEEHKFIKRASLDEKNGTISIQFPAMLEVTQKNGGTVELEEGEWMIYLPPLTF